MKEHNKWYWFNKKERTEIAKKHTEDMVRKYREEIMECVKSTRIYSNSFSDTEDVKVKYLDNITMSVVQADTVSTLMQYTEADGRIAVLNFASYKFPGGGFMVGSRAQEECLCHDSFLYNVLKEFEGTYYEKNRKDLNRGLYRDKALYSPDVIFEKDGEMKKCDVITCAAPNFSVAERFVSRGVNNTCLRNRTRFILEIAKIQNIDTFIVGAWGCGVFQQDPRAVAKCFIDEVEKVFVDAKIHLVFAVIPPLPNQTDNSTPFVKAIDEWNEKKKN